MNDRIGIGWRPDLAAGILSRLDQIDVVEVIADNYFHAPQRKLRALRTLTTQVPVVLHGVSLGLASSVAAESRRLDRMARVVNEVQPEFWSEHLAFVRGGGCEIGHLAAPPRTGETVEGTAANVARARAVVGAAPLLENIATLIAPPGSRYDEPAWVSKALSASGCGLLLDLHNLYANALNFGGDPFHMLARMPAERITVVHLAGGRWITADGLFARAPARLLDDHLHDVPEAVYDLLTEVGRRAPGPVTVILERDGQYPSMDCLLEQLQRARRALALGRTQRTDAADMAGTPEYADREEGGDRADMPALEAFLSRLYVDGEARRRFLADPRRETAQAGLTQEESAALEQIDQVGLTMAARSFARKRQGKQTRWCGGPVSRWLGWLQRVVG